MGLVEVGGGDRVEVGGVAAPVGEEAAFGGGPAGAVDFDGAIGVLPGAGLVDGEPLFGVEDEGGGFGFVAVWAGNKMDFGGGGLKGEAVGGGFVAEEVGENVEAEGVLEEDVIVWGEGEVVGVDGGSWHFVGGAAKGLPGWVVFDDFENEIVGFVELDLDTPGPGD